MTRLRLWLARLLLPRGWRAVSEWDEALVTNYIAWLKNRAHMEDA